jgi:hypothetical protein
VALGGKHFTRQSAEAPLHAVADDGLPDLLADGESDALGLIAVLAISDEQDEARHRGTLSSVRGQEVRAFTENC